MILRLLMREELVEQANYVHLISLDLDLSRCRSVDVGLKTNTK